jgi:hypothetical protein
MMTTLALLLLVASAAAASASADCAPVPLDAQFWLAPTAGAAVRNNVDGASDARAKEKKMIFSFDKKIDFFLSLSLSLGQKVRSVCRCWRRASRSAARFRPSLPTRRT